MLRLVRFSWFFLVAPTTRGALSCTAWNHGIASKVIRLSNQLVVSSKAPKKPIQSTTRGAHIDISTTILPVKIKNAENRRLNRCSPEVKLASVTMRATEELPSNGHGARIFHFRANDRAMATPVESLKFNLTRSSALPSAACSASRIQGLNVSIVTCLLPGPSVM